MENARERKAGPRRHGAGGWLVQLADSGPTRSASRFSSTTNGMTGGYARLLALRPYLPQVRRANNRSSMPSRRWPICTARRSMSSRLPIILDKNPHAHFANAEDATQIAEWVKAGGVLVIMENDTSFADLDHFNVDRRKIRHSLQQRAAQARRRHTIGSKAKLSSTAAGRSSITRTRSM